MSFWKLLNVFLSWTDLGSYHWEGQRISESGWLHRRGNGTVTQDPALGLSPCSRCLEILNHFCTRGPTFSFWTGP